MDAMVTSDSFGPDVEHRPKKGRPRLWGLGPHVLTDAWIISIEGLDGQLAACKTHEEFQRVIDSVHEVPHIYRISGNSNKKTWNLRVGPMILPVCNPMYIFSIEVERRDSDKVRQSPLVWLEYVDAADAPPRSFVPGSFKITTMFVSPQEYQRHLEKGLVNSKASSFYGKNFLTTHPTFLFCKEVVHRFTRNSSWHISETERLMVLNAKRAGEKLPSGTMHHIHSESVCQSLTDFEIGDGRRQMALYNRIDSALSLRELFLGPDYLTMCRYFLSGDLIKMSPPVFRNLCSKLPKSVELIYAAFLRQERLGRRFFDGASLVRFLDERVTDEHILETVLPLHHSIKAGSRWAAHTLRLERKEESRRAAEAAALSMGAPRHTPMVHLSPSVVKRGRKLASSTSSIGSVQLPVVKKRSAADTMPIKPCYTKVDEQRHAPLGVVDDPDSKLSLSNWFTTMRGVFYNLVGIQGLELGSFYPRSVVVTDEERPYVQYMVDKEILKMYPAFNPRGSSLTRRHYTEQDCGKPAYEIHTNVLYTVHPFMQTRTTLDTIRDVLGMLAGGYRDRMTDYTRMCSRNIRFDAKTQTLTYEQEYHSLAKNYDMCAKMNGGILTEELSKAHDRLMVLSRRKRPELEKHESDWIDSHSWLDHQRAIIEDDLLTRDAVPEENTTFWSGMAELRIGGPREFRYCDSTKDNFLGRFDQCVQKRIKNPGAAKKLPPPPDSVIEEAKQLMRKALRHSVVILDLPESNVGERRSPHHNAADLFAAMAREMADMCFGPGEVPYASVATRDSLVFRRREVLKTPSAKLISLHEVEKWTPGDLQEVLSACFFDWDGCDSWKAPVNSHVLWLWVDRTAIDMGGFSVLLENTAIPQSAVLDLRSICVTESECAGLAATLLFRRAQLDDSCAEDENEDESFFIDVDGTKRSCTKKESRDIPMVKERLVIVKTNCQDINMEMIDTATGATIRECQADPKQISMNALPSIRLGAERPAVGWVELSSLSSWREIYTLMCHVKCALILKGGTKSLDLLLEASAEDFLRIAVSDDWDSTASDLFIDPDDGRKKRLLFSPRGHLDIYTDLNNPIQPGPPQTVYC